MNKIKIGQNEKTPVPEEEIGKAVSGGVPYSTQNGVA